MEKHDASYLGDKMFLYHCALIEDKKVNKKKKNFEIEILKRKITNIINSHPKELF